MDLVSARTASQAYQALVFQVWRNLGVPRRYASSLPPKRRLRLIDALLCRP